MTAFPKGRSHPAGPHGRAISDRETRRPPSTGPRASRMALPLAVALGALLGSPFSVLAPSSVLEPVLAQETEGPLAPAGRLRLQVFSTFTSWDQRFGARTVDGVTVEETEPLGFDLSRDDWVSLFPGVPGLEEALSELVDDDVDALLGATRFAVSADRTRVPIRLDLGVLDRLSIGVTVPFVKNRTEVSFDFDSTGTNLGLNPAATDPAAVLQYLDDLGRAASEARGLAEEACAGDPDGSTCLEALALADDLGGFLGGLTGAYGASLLFPHLDSVTGASLRDRSGVLSSRLAGLGLGEIGVPLPLAVPIRSRDDLDLFMEGALGLEPFGNRVGLWELGDVEVHAAARLFSGVRRDAPDGPVRARWDVGAGLLVRLGTGALDDPNSLLDLPSGDGQTDIEGRLFANLAWGRMGLWTDLRYGVQLSTRTARRIAPPDFPLTVPATLAAVEWTPGNYLDLELAPRYHLTETLAFVGAYRLSTKGSDTFRRLTPAGDPPEPPVPAGPLFADAELLELETEETVHQLAGALVFNTLRAWRDGEAAAPFEARFGVRAAIAGSGGRTPKTFSTEFGVRLYRRFWGR